MILFRLLAPILLVLLAWWGLRRLRQRFNLNARQFSWLVGITAVMLVVLLLVIMGRLPIQAVAAPVLFVLSLLLRNAHWLARLFPMLQRQRRQAGGSAGAGASSADVSSIRTEWLAMELRHDSGAMDGEVLKGRFQEQRLSQLALAELLELAGECRDDTDSLQILQAYLDREHPDWREQASAGDQEQASAQGAEPSAMNETEALAILGLEPGAGRDDIVRAHRRLMQKMHPDRGGSDYLAQRINDARDFLLGRS